MNGGAQRSALSPVEFVSMASGTNMRSIPCCAFFSAGSFLAAADFCCTRPRLSGTEKRTYLQAGRAQGRARWHHCRRKAASSLMKFPCFAGKTEFGARTEPLFGVSFARLDRIQVLPWRGFFVSSKPRQNRGSPSAPRPFFSPLCLTCFFLPPH